MTGVLARSPITGPAPIGVPLVASPASFPFGDKFTASVRI